MSEEHTEIKRRRGIYLLPNLFTTACLFAGFFAIVSAIGGRFEAAGIAIFIAMAMDGLDGRVARMTNTQTEFGTQYDSLADMVSFGLAPSLVMYQWALSGMGKLGWLAAFIFTAGAALRLARFNTQAAVAVDKRYFQGLPSPPAAALIAFSVWVGTDYGIAGEDVKYVAFFMTIIGGVLMVSNIRYRSFKDFDLKGKVPFVSLFAVVLIFVTIALDPPTVLFMMASTFAVSGPLMTVIGLRHRSRQKEKRQEEGGNPPS